MLVKRLIYALGAVWLALFVSAFLGLQVTEPAGSEFARSLNRMVSFLTWHGGALVVAAVLALITRLALARGVEKIRLIGFLPLAVSVFLVVSLIAIIGYRVLVAPSFG